MKTEFVGTMNNCPHSLVVHIPVKGRNQTDYRHVAEPCVVKQHKGKRPIHRTSTGTRWF